MADQNALPPYRSTTLEPRIYRKARVVTLSPVVLPDFSDLDDSVARKLKSGIASLKNWRYLSSHDFILEHCIDPTNHVAPPDKLRHLDHPDGGAYRELASIRSASFSRSELEQVSLSQLNNPAPPEYFDLRSFLKELSTKIAPSEGYRRVAVGSARNARGWRVVYPAPDVIDSEVLALQRWISTNEFQSPIWTASLAMVSLSTLHPFLDSNGRASRILFNAILQRHGTPRDTYIPLSEIFASCPGGKELREKTGYYRGNWNPFSCFMVDVIRVARLAAC